MNSVERHERRYQRRMAKRKQKKLDRVQKVGTLTEAMPYHILYKAGKKCCNGVRWKQSIQTFERHLFSKVAVSSRALATKLWRPGKYTHFLLNERGKTRPIDAPFLQDRPLHKAYTQKVLLPLYMPDMIYNNGASLKGKGLTFSFNLLKKDLRSFYRKYGLNGNIILLDFKQFFPSVKHEALFDRHNRLLLDDSLKWFGDMVVKSNGLEYGMPLGVEPSQAEMIALPSALDNFIKCQLGLRFAGHYMDDYYILVPPDLDPKKILSSLFSKSEEIGLTISRNKTRIQPINKPFKYCKAKYIIGRNGHIVIRANRDSLKRARRKIKAFKEKLDKKLINYNDLWYSINGIFAYFIKYNNHKNILSLRRLFYSIYGFSSEKYENFVERENQYGLHLCKAL